jgi:hypothetical protein
MTVRRVCGKVGAVEANKLHPMKNILSVLKSQAFLTVVLGVIVAGMAVKAARKFLPGSFTVYLP